MAITPRTFALFLAAAVAVLAIVLLSTNVEATTAGGATVTCGTGWKTDTREAAHKANVDALTNAMLADSGYAGLARPTATTGYEQQCASSLSTRRSWGFGLGGVAVVVALGALVVRRAPARAEV